MRTQSLYARLAVLILTCTLSSAALVMTGVYAFAFAGQNVMLPPVWVRVAMLIVTPSALMAGASIRAQARVIQQEAAAERPEERS